MATWKEDELNLLQSNITDQNTQHDAGSLAVRICLIPQNQEIIEAIIENFLACIWAAKL